MAHDQCNCATICPDYAQCAITWVYELGQCAGTCFGLVSRPDREDETLPAKVALDSRIDLDMRGASLGNVGRLIAAITDAQIFVPADRIDECPDLYLQDVPVDTAVRELGLMAVERP